MPYEVHELVLTIPAGENQGITPYMWDHGTYNPEPNRVMDTLDFTIDPDHHFFCFNATVTGNSPGICSIVLRSNAGERCTMNADVNGGEDTMDWISVTPGKDYFFRITNHTSSVVKVYLKYYSFNN